MEELDRVRIAAVLAADPELQARVSLAPDPRGQPHQPADTGSVDRLERAAVDDLAVDVRRDEFRLDVVAREAERGLGQVVVPNEKKSACSAIRFATKHARGNSIIVPTV